ncbi:MAG: extracellular solute-binding protein, partial [Xanthomonas perforans]|nr:extracellular solute-binding protein [Xanthomonas perforans]
TSNEDQLALFDEIADAYIADHPEVESITFDPLDFDSYTTTLTTQLAGGNPPDMAWLLENAAPDFVSSGALVPLDDVLSSTDGYELDDLSES